MQVENNNMPTTYFLAPIPRWQFTKNDGLYDVRGKLYTRRAVAHDEDKPTFQDATGLFPYPNPIVLDGVGSVGAIYWASDEQYYIELRDQNDSLIWSQDNYPGTGSGGGGNITMEVDYDNHISNAQFRWHDAKALSNFEVGNTRLAQGWLIYKDNVTATDKVSFEEFLPGSPPITIEGNPKYYLKYACTVAGTGESSKYIFQPIQDVRTFASKEITINLVAKSSTTSSIDILMVQYFGTGGSASPSVVTPVTTFALTSTFDKYSATISVPSISGKTIGSNKDDELLFVISLPKNATCEIDITNVQINLGNKILMFQYENVFFDLGKVLSGILMPRNQTKYPALVQGWEPVDGYIPVEESQFLSITRTDVSPAWSSDLQPSYLMLGNPPVGSTVHWWTDNIPDGFLLCNGQFVAKSKYPRLFRVWGLMYSDPNSAENLSATVSSNEVTGTMFKVGVVAHIADINTGFSFSVVQAGTNPTVAPNPVTPGLKEIFKITCNSGATLQGGEYFQLQVPGGTMWIHYFIVDGNYKKIPSIPSGYSACYTYVNKSDSATTIAAKLGNTLNPMGYSILKTSGLFIRSTDEGSGVDPDAASRIARPDGIAGPQVGTTQDSENKSHTHGATRLEIQHNPDVGVFGGIYKNQDVTLPDGGAEARPKNIYAKVIVRY